MQEVDGGAFFAAVLAGIAIVGAVIYVYNNEGDMVQGFKDGMNGTYTPPTPC
jgi:hypothetical protein